MTENYKYKVEVRNSPGWQKHSVATLGVSVTSPNWQAEKLSSIIDFAIRNFDIIRIDITDALYRHSYMAKGCAPEEALARANSLGALWLSQHADMLENMPITSKIIRWQDWYEHPGYQETLRDFHNAYTTNMLLRDAVQNDASEFYMRKNVVPSKHELVASYDYMLEELAVITLQARELPGLRIYPGDELRCFSIVRAGQIAEAPKGLENEQFAKIKFDKRAVVQAAWDAA